MTRNTTNLTIRMDSSVKKQADALFSDLGMNLSTAFNVFVRQAIRMQRLPFEISREVPTQDTLDAIREAEQIARDPMAKGFADMSELLKDLNG